MLKNITISIFIILGFHAKAQTELPYIEPYLIFFHGGYEQCDESAIAYLEFEDSTLVPFNEFSTFESRLNAKKAHVFLSAGKYRILYISKLNGSIEAASFEIKKNNQLSQIVVNINSLYCCINLVGTYLIYEPQSKVNFNDDCYNIEETIKKIQNSNNNFKIVGVTTDSISKTMAKERAELIYQELIENKIPKEKLTIEIIYYKSPPNYIKGKIMIYSEDKCMENGCKVGIIIQENN